MNILDIKNLNLYFDNDNDSASNKLQALSNINLQIERGKIVGIAGESGCGKTLTSLAILNLLPKYSSYNASHMIFDNKDLMTFSKEERHSLAGRDISMIFQDPMASLNPTLKVGYQIYEVLLNNKGNSDSSDDNKVAQKISKAERKKKVIELLSAVGINNASERYNSYPFELSGGMCQRVMIAMAIACKPKLLIADEPTTGLDVTIQKQILSLLLKIQKDFGLSILIISHDLSLLASFCDELCIMYAGTIVESGKVEDIIQEPKHPYTQGLINCLPSSSLSLDDIPVIKGSVPALKFRKKDHCQFLNRCHHKIDGCQNFKLKSNYNSFNQHFSNCLLDTKL